MKAQAKKISNEPPVKRMVENIIRCKWSLSVIELVRNGVKRPGAIERSVDGLTTKVLNERLRKLIRFGILEKTIFPETPPRVEYELTEFGRKFTGLLDAIDALEKEFEGN
ncbi:MAG TPA: helix-turn-helix domain-containing protein [Pyrinomonadaceae bacterium]|nr:helix-turn-helix domain-containing protein [Pyrinomonadaceae bacterium]